MIKKHGNEILDIESVLTMITEQITKILNSESSLLVLVAGGSCSGKTYFATRLMITLEEVKISASVITLDDYFKDVDDLDFPKDNFGRFYFDCPAAYDIKEFRDDVIMLLKGKDIFSPDYDLLINKRKSRQGKLVKAAKVIIADGLFAIKELINIRPRLFKIFIEADETTRLKGRIKRDLKYQVSENLIVKFFYEKVEPGHQKFVMPQKAEADFVIVNNYCSF
jgi:uridine kinase